MLYVNDALNTFYLRLYGVGHMAKDHSNNEESRRHMGYSFQLAARKDKKEMCYLTTHSTHFIYGYMASDIW